MLTFGAFSFLSLTGDWSVNLFQAQPMPFDGVLFASRVMVAAEAHTSPSVKQLIVDAPGVDDDKWEGTYDKETGGILTVRSELGEPIHKIATRAVKLWREFDDTVFNMPKEKRAAWLESKKDYVIGRLNADFNKPWFGEKADGTVVSNIGDMTYEEVTRRMIRLMYVAKQSRWVDISLRNLTGDWLRRVEERFAGVNGGGVKHSILQSFASLDDPLPYVETFFAAYPAAKEQLLAAEDKAFFLNISQRPGQKPVPFIPVLDATFEVWFKKVRDYFHFPFQFLFLSLCLLFNRLTFAAFSLPLIRTRSGPPRTSTPSSTPTPSVSAFFRDPSPSSTARARTSPSRSSSATSSLSSPRSSSTVITTAMSPRSLPSTTSVPPLSRPTAPRSLASRSRPRETRPSTSLATRPPSRLSPAGSRPSPVPR